MPYPLGHTPVVTIFLISGGIIRPLELDGVFFEKNTFFMTKKTMSKNLIAFFP